MNHWSVAAAKPGGAFEDRVNSAVKGFTEIFFLRYSVETAINAFTKIKDGLILPPSSSNRELASAIGRTFEEELRNHQLDGG